MIVLIVPLWNWNLISPLFAICYEVVLIVPLWNWNSWRNKGYSKMKKSFNRTFMELKSCCFLAVSFAPMCFNRTFMELKSCSVLLVWGLAVVLIVPLWNWNRTYFKSWKETKSFNRTFMELKWQRVWQNTTKRKVLIVPLWNWNWNSVGFPVESNCFNRTFMELKLKFTLGR